MTYKVNYTINKFNYRIFEIWIGSDFLKFKDLEWSFE